MLINDFRQSSLYETNRASKGMGLLNAPGPDGYQDLFFNRMWGLTGHALHHFAQRVLRGEDFPQEAADALLMLISKEDKPSSLRSFGPINLCNINMKVVSKLTVNRLKVVLHTLISPNEASFVPGRQSLDNIIIS